MPQLNILAQYRGADRIDMRTAEPAGTVPQGVGCGKSVDQMRRETEVFLSRIFKREITINEPYKP